MIITISKVLEGREKSNTPARSLVVTPVEIIRTIRTPIRIVKPSVRETTKTKTISVKAIPRIVID
jgi:hypothetical protein